MNNSNRNYFLFAVIFFVFFSGNLFSQPSVRKKADEYNAKISLPKKLINEFVKNSPFNMAEGKMIFSKAHEAYGIKIPYYNIKDSALWPALKEKLKDLRKEISKATEDKTINENAYVKNYFVNQYLTACFIYEQNDTKEDKVYCLDRKCRQIINGIYVYNPAQAWVWQCLFRTANRYSGFSFDDEPAFDDDRYTYFFDDPEKDFFFENSIGYYYSEYTTNYNSTYNDSTGEETIVRDRLSDIMMHLENCLDSFSAASYPNQLKFEKRIQELAAKTSENKINNSGDFYYVSAITKVLLNNHYPAAAKKCLSRLCEFKSHHEKNKSMIEDYYDLDYLLLTYGATFVDSSFQKCISPSVKKLGIATQKLFSEIKITASTFTSWYLPDSLSFFLQSAEKSNYPQSKIVELIKKADKTLEEKRSLIMLKEYLDMKGDMIGYLSRYKQYEEAKKCALQMKNILSGWLKMAEFSNLAYGNTRNLESDFRKTKETFDVYKDFRKFISFYYPENKSKNISKLFKSDTLEAVYEERKKNEYTWMGYRFPVQLKDTAINLNDYFENFFSSAAGGKRDTCKLFFNGTWFNYFVLRESALKIGTFPFASDLSRNEMANLSFFTYNTFEELGIEYELNDVVGFTTRNINELDKYKYAETVVEYSEFLRSSGFTEQSDSLRNRCFRFYLSRGDSVSSYFGRLAGILSLYEENPAKKIYFARHCNRVYSYEGKNSNNLSRSNGILSSAWLDLNKPDSAKQYIDRMLDYHRTITADTTSIEYALKLTSSGRYYKQKNNLDSAIYFYSASVNIYLRNSDSLSNIEPFLQLAALYDKKDLKEKAYQIYSVAFSSIQFLLEKNFPYLSDDEKLSFFIRTKEQTDIITKFYCSNLEKFPLLGKKLFEFSSAYKGSVVKTSAYLKKIIGSVNDSRIKEVYKKYYELKEKQDGDSPENDIRVTMMERYLTQLVKELNDGKENKKPAISDLSKNLSADEAVVNIIYYENGEEVYKHGNGKYFAQILKKDSERPLYADLGSAVSLEKEGFKQYRNEMSTSALPDAKNCSYNFFFSSIAGELKGISKIYFCGDGVYNKINLNSIYDPSAKKYLLDQYSFVQTTSPDEIVSLKKATDRKKYSQFLVVGNVKFSTCKKPHKHDPVINPLPGTLGEYKEVLNKLREGHEGAHKWFVLADKEAQEIFFKWEFNSGKDTCQLVHIATHGFYVPDKKEFIETLTTEKDSGITFRSAANFKVNSKNPFLRSGLLFSGSENTLNDELITDTVWNNSLEKYSKENDGILTAYEIMDLNLSGTELVVLSACESGLGSIVNGVGVNGLQKAFKTAGAKKIIMSLWPVDDQATKEFMSDFYSNLFGNTSKTKFDINASMIVTMKKMKEKYKTPLLWAPFILVN